MINDGCLVTWISSIGYWVIYNIVLITVLIKNRCFFYPSYKVIFIMYEMIFSLILTSTTLSRINTGDGQKCYVKPVSSGLINWAEAFVMIVYISMVVHMLNVYYTF